MVHLAVRLLCVAFYVYRCNFFVCVRACVRVCVCVCVCVLTLFNYFLFLIVCVATI